MARINASCKRVVICLRGVCVAGLLALVGAKPPLGSETWKTLNPSSAFNVSIDGAPQFVFQATADGLGLDIYTGLNASFVYVSLSRHQLPRAARRLEIAPAVVFKRAQLWPRGSPNLQVTNTSIIVEIDASGQYMLELDGDLEFATLATGLMIFVEIEDDIPDRQSVHYFGPGLHKLPYDLEFGGRLLMLVNDSTVYLDEGAVVLGYVRGDHVRNVTIRGRGMLAASFWPGDPVPVDQTSGCCCAYYGLKAIQFSSSSNVTIDGITIIHATSWNLEVLSSINVHIRGLKIIAWQCMNDGIDVVSSQHVLIEQCFIRSNDDAIVLKGNDPTMETRSVLVQDNLLWGQTFGNCMEIGFELWNAAVSNVAFKRNTCFHSARAIISIHNAGHAGVHDITYSNIVAEGVLPKRISKNPDQGLQLLDLTILAGQYSGPDLLRRGSISNILFSDIVYHPNKIQYLFSRLLGNSSSHRISHLVFDSFQIGDFKAASISDLNATTAFLSDVIFRRMDRNIFS